jgi:hypothetical protein
MLLTIATKAYELSFIYQGMSISHYIFSVLALLIAALAFSKERKTPDLFELTFTVFVVYVLMCFILPELNFYLKFPFLLLSFNWSFAMDLYNTFSAIVWYILSGFFLYGLALVSYENIGVVAAFSKVIYRCKQRQFFLIFSFIPLGLFLFISTGMQKAFFQKYWYHLFWFVPTNMINYVFFSIYAILFLASFFWAYWAFKKEMPEEMSEETAAEMPEGTQELETQTQTQIQTKQIQPIYRFNFLRKTSITLLLLSPFISILIFLVVFGTSLPRHYVNSSIYEMKKPYQLTDQLNKIVIYSWILWLLLSTAIIIIKKTENPPLVILTLVP